VKTSAGEAAGHAAGAPGHGRLFPPSCIVTFEALPGFGLSDVDVLIRADGGPGLPPLGRQALLKSVHEAGRPLALLDVVDRGHPLLRTWFRQRREAYGERGWYGAGVDAEAERARAFLAVGGGTRPKCLISFPGNGV
jgi:hypothetical protein